MMFMFNFNNVDSSTTEVVCDNQKMIEAEEISMTTMELEDIQFQSLTFGNNTMKVITEDPSTHSSDLIPGIYEGGYKLWECTADMLNYLSNNINIVKGNSILDLGCGMGLLGVQALMFGAKNVDFQDYNKEVLINVAMKNVCLNCIEKSDSCKYFSGDWDSFTILNENTYDVILTSETIYNVSYYMKLINLFKNKLKPNGIIFLIAKNYYFGVGGSITEFLNVLKSFKLNAEIIWSSTDGVKKTLLKIYF
ncbi:histidine protein methyltransferase 1 homolog [Adelges cooleyi]|uniref:histidine protein methyltransferase 1 homolog n=1 Tax=Adelges cooleyi TaxID=133065 RepID=UPI00217F7FC4|nr:histidine protein methyltransferase 1 homolog [Adelges cooleyi]